jgi:copper resistance protein C
MRKLPILVITFALLVGLTSAAFAHAHLVKSQPVGGSIVKVAPRDLTLWFSEPLEPAFCTVEVVDDSGNRFDQGKATVDASDGKILHAALKELPPGSYKAAWRVVSVDSHHTEGHFSFKVRA